MLQDQLCYVAPDHDKEMMIISDGKTYELPNGQVIKVGGDACFKAPELLFHPSLYQIKSDGLSEIILDSISKCDENMRSELYGNIVLAGGSTLFPGFKDRLERDL
ncbi:hypothetical protein BOTBODRAFT_175021 [Botryobasidium botryosum FD-172 SS1]|uniref:Actin n=1 Tax=Botryobasidium botryosum (strain FD-172 SS1) TaxID=930990 RepID=A0A067MFB9_BOTB1|nr:hypothetical protein BOTBODRAFT_175021 [Botryobasidium botryosum FD-172 SS1]